MQHPTDQFWRAWVADGGKQAEGLAAHGWFPGDRRRGASPGSCQNPGGSGLSTGPRSGALELSLVLFIRPCYKARTTVLTSRPCRGGCC